MKLQLGEGSIAASDDIEFECTVVRVYKANNTHRRKRVQVRVLQGLDMVESANIEHLTDKATVLVKDFRTYADKLFILGHVDGVPKQAR